jgi:hypothetical protein
MGRSRLNLGCTAWRHRRLGVDAVINARSGRQDLNEQTAEDVELVRDALAIRSCRLNHMLCSKSLGRRLGRFVLMAD